MNSLEEKITAHYGTIYLISFTKSTFFQNILMNKKNHSIISEMCTHLRAFRVFEAVLWSLFFGIMTAVFVYLFEENTQFIATVFGGTFTVALLIFLQKKALGKINENYIASYLNFNYPTLENSADLLLLNENNLPHLAQIQRQKVALSLIEIEPQIKLPHQVEKAFFSFILISIAALSIFLLKNNFIENNNFFTENIPTNKNESIKDTIVEKTVYKEIILQKIKLHATPPPYTRTSSFTSESPSIKAPVDSDIKWSLRFSGSIKSGFIRFQNDKKIPLEKQNRRNYTASFTLKENIIYNIEYADRQGNVKTTDYYKIEATPDFPPDIRVEGLEAYAQYLYDTLQTISFAANVKDDYGISDARMIATLSRGEGEAVKFRDDTLFFNQNFVEKNTTYQLAHKIELHQVGMQPGDELYLHIEATDNRQPKPQAAKTFKYIIAFADTTEVDFEMEGSLALDRMPAYFRSQRQIIIDTEKLIAQKGKISEKEFNETSNGIAADQKILRLRYGKFLGEEFETVIGAVTSATLEDEDEHDHENHEEGKHDNHEGHDHEAHDHEEGKEHEHDENCEHQHEETSAHQHVSTSGHGGHEGHDHAQQHADGEAEDPIEPYIHAHDQMEEATFFDATTSGKLRAALSKMWDAELHLRLNEPEKALPYEYAALKLIKEVQQASRVYVERIGYDAPVIKVAEKRLTGELNDAISLSLLRDNAPKDAFVSMRQAVDILERLKQENRRPNRSEKVVLNDAGNEIAALALTGETGYFRTLRALKILTENDLESAYLQNYLSDIQGKILRILPDTKSEPTQRTYPKNQLTKMYLKQIR